MRLRGLLASAAMVAGLASPALALPSSVTSGNLTFSNFSCSVATNSGFATPGGSNCASNFTATPITGGVSIQGLLAAGNGTLDGTEDVVMAEQVSSSSGPISTANLTFNGTSISSALSHITETVWNSDPFTNPSATSLAQLVVSNPPAGFLSDSATLSSPQSTVWITKDIGLFATAPGIATISIIDQTFGPGGTPTPTPEPISIALLGTGLVGLSFARRRPSA